MQVESIADTAYWVAYHRAIESERPDALFRDPFARVLAGPRGEQFATSRNSLLASGIIAQRTAVFDELILRLINADIDLVLNLAAGLDTRPYRLPLPSWLRWIEVDLPETLSYKRSLLSNEQPVCQLESIALDLSDRTARSEVFVGINSEAKRALVLTEGLLLYLPQDEVANLASDLHKQRNFSYWMTDLMSPLSLQMMSAKLGQRLKAAEATLRFAPKEGPGFFRAYGWEPIAQRPAFAEMRRLKRLPTLTAMFASLLESLRALTVRSMDGTILLRRLPTLKEE